MKNLLSKVLVFITPWVLLLKQLPKDMMSQENPKMNMHLKVKKGLQMLKSS